MRRNNTYIESVRTWDKKVIKAPRRGSRDEISPVAGPESKTRTRAKRDIYLRTLEWSCHFMTIQLHNGLIFTMFAVNDERTRECLRILASDYISVQNVTDELFGLFLQRGIPKYLFALDGGELMPRAIREWLEKLEIGGVLVESKKCDENGRCMPFRDELTRALAGEKRLASLTDVGTWLENWRRERNRSINLFRYSLESENKTALGAL